MKIRLHYLFLITLIIFTFTNNATAANYHKSGKFFPIKLTYSDMSTFLERLHKTLPPPEQLDSSYSMNRVTISDGDIQVWFDLYDDYQIAGLARLPTTAFDFEYFLFNPGGDVENIIIRFSDYKREVSVDGDNPDKVNAIYGYIEGEMKKHTTWIGGEKFRGMAGALFLMLAIVFTFQPNSLIGDISFNKRNLLRMLGLIILICLLVLPFGRWLPGFLIFSGPSSFFIKYSNQIAFVGALLTLGSIVLTTWALRRKKS